MYNPISTYRIQFNKEFTFSQFEKIIPYLHKLGVRTIYASPILRAVPGSNHGYDVLDPNKINPEIGTEEQLMLIQQQLKSLNIGWLQDFVPNHMAFETKNPWIHDVLEKGERSLFAQYFDIDWSRKPLMLPVLGKTLEETVIDGEIAVKFSNGRFYFSYYETLYPLQPASSKLILQTLPEQFKVLVEAVLENLTLAETTDDDYTYSTLINSTFQKLADASTDKPLTSQIENVLKNIIKNPEFLWKILSEQFYMLCHWQQTDHEINFRRFFTINSLICLNIHYENVFDDYHSYIKSLLDIKLINGLRIDHIDGLYDPSQYLEKLRALAGDDVYIAVEKILENNESLPEQWNVQGATGYEFLASANNILTLKNSEEIFSQAYSSITDNYRTVSQQVIDKKSFILYNYMQGELENLFQLLLHLHLLKEEEKQNLMPEHLKKAIAVFLFHFPVYRFYSNSIPLLRADAIAVKNIFIQLKQVYPDIEPALQALQNIFTHAKKEKKYLFNASHFFKRCMQFTGPLMAKGVEDTLMYTYNRFIVHNEVGDSPESFGCTVEEFHLKMLNRQQEWPLALNATATHDTKRGEDARARLNVLSDIPHEWFRKVAEWQHHTASLKMDAAPDANDEYFIYQTLIASYPMPGEDEDDFTGRVQAYVQKALREAKRHSNWNTPNENYEKATSLFIQNILKKESIFYKSFQDYLNKIVDFGIINSLVQLLLKCTCPGVPDIYQGCELWDLSFVDPDNRRSVDFDKRISYIKKLEEKTTIDNLWQERYNGKIKLWLLNHLLHERTSDPNIFSKGNYLALKVTGKYKKNIIAFARQHEGKFFIVIAPLHLAAICKQQKKDWNKVDWEDTQVIIPGSETGEAFSSIDKNKIIFKEKIAINGLFKTLPFTILNVYASSNKRGAGILLHITSLPSDFGIGDLGNESRQFADFLHKSKQKYWQLLPLNPIEEGQGYSPYSSTSSMAGNTLLISLYDFVKEGLLKENDLDQFYLPSKSKVNFKKAEKNKNILFRKAWETFNLQKPAEDESQYNIFCSTEKEWLDDFALYIILKKQFKNKPWYEWPEEYKYRNPSALLKISLKQNDELKYHKWLQYIFHKQWHQLKNYCNKLNIKLFGDLPFYISYDSADVWSHTHLFKLDVDGNMVGVAGVPPDAFSDDGQLWGMPVFDWHKMKDDNYAWWLKRLKKNIELFDLVRLDHFRAFSAFWEVVAGEKTAKKGKWKQGPRKDFFDVIKKEIGELPFIAEDLGDIDDAVYDLRDYFNLPGMKVLQFAFGDDMSTSPHIPHNYDTNYVVYTGTHDNNTIRGWYRQDKKVHKNLESYLQKNVVEKNIHVEMAKLAYASVANIAILPIQDVIALDETGRMNMPSSPSGNWHWRLLRGQLSDSAQQFLSGLTEAYNRF
ncbi:MAG: malto-oligosyltrehalose synthase [Chitinophagaceae bacterium]